MTNIIHIKDFCEAFNILFDRGKHLNIYNIGTEERVKIKKIVHILENITKNKVRISNSSIKKGGTKHRCPSIKKIKKLGFKPKVTLRKGIEDVFFTKYNN